MKPKAAFIIVCWNNEPLLKECLGAIKQQTYPNLRTIMVDNGSQDNSVATARQLMTNIEIIEAGANLGFAKGNNVGIHHALQDPEVAYIALLNSDATMSPDWLEKIIEFCELKPRAACLQGTTLDYYDHGIIDSTHIYIARNGQATQSHWRQDYQADYGPKKVFGVNAAACVVTRKFIEAQPEKDGLFDETLFMYLEDVDMAARATVMGWDNYLVPGARAYHMGSASSGKKPGFSLFLTYRNNLAVLCKNIPVTMLLRMAPKIIRADYHTIRHLRRTNQADAVPYLIKGRLIGLLRLPLFIPSIITMHRYRKVVSRDYLWQLMRNGD